MASFRQKGLGWEASVDMVVGGVRIRKAQVFETKGRAKAWAAEFESTARAERRGEVVERPLSDLFKEYQKRISPQKDGEVWEVRRLNAFLADDIAKATTLSIKPADIARWRDRRLQTVSPATVLREWTLMSNVFTVARKEWGWMGANPMSDVERPAAPLPRDRRPTPEEIETLCHVLGYSKTDSPETESARVAAAFLFACETGMRAGEICALEWHDVDVEKRTAKVRAESRGARKSPARVVPLTLEAVRLVNQMPALADTVFALKGASLDALFRRARAKGAIEGLHFHDSRAEALTRLSQKVDVLTLAKISGHRDLKILLNTYYRPKMEEVAARLG